MFGQRKNRIGLGAGAAGRLRRGLAVAAATALIGFTAGWTQTAPPIENPPRPADAASLAVPRGGQASRMRLREGTELTSLRGWFRMVDGRILFFPSQDDAPYIGLENLNLERIAAELASSPSQLEWSISGTITEFRGTNYLLVRRAILFQSASSQDAAPPGTP